MYLVSGGGSFVGLNIAQRLVNAGEKVVLTTRRRDDRATAKISAESGGLASVEVLDLTNMYQVNDLFSRHEFRRVIHTATAHMYANTRASNYPSYQMLFNMLEAATAFRLERFVLCNSIVVYRGVTGPYREHQPLPTEFENDTGGPLAMVPNFEVTLKRVMEALVLDYGLPMKSWGQAPQLGHDRTASQLETAVMRLPSQVGPFYSSMYNPVACLAHAYVRNRPEIARTQPLRPFVDIGYVVDTSAATVAVARADELPHRIYNASSDMHYTGRELLQAFYKVAPDAESRLGIDPANVPEMDSNNFLDISRLKADLGWQPKYDVETMFAEYIDWLSQNPN